MGTVTRSTLLRPDGSVDRYEGEVLETNKSGCLALHYDYDARLLPGRYNPERGMWRYRDLLPVGSGPILYPLEVGGTPLVAPRRAGTEARPYERRTGAKGGAGRETHPYGDQATLSKLYLKDETRSPTGSNKDRATALVLEMAMRGGIKTVTCASTGNVAVSLAIGSGAAGINAVIFVPAIVASSKLQVMLLAGATVIMVEEGYEAAFNLSRTAAKAFGWYDRNTGANPMTLEAKKTVAFEIWEQLGRAVPDAVIVPVGDGTTLSAIAKGFRELVTCGVTGRMPRIIGVQAEGCQPLKRAWERDEQMSACLPETLADGIAVGNPISGVMALRDVRETGGGFVAVPDAAMLEAIRVLASTAGLVAEPAAASGFAGIASALRSGLIEPDETVVVLITGSGLKTPQFLQPTGKAFTVRGELSEVERALASRHEG